MKRHYDSIIVGGGVIGSSIAFQLSKRNHRVLVLEKDGLAEKASSAAAGMLGAQSELEGDSPLFNLARQSRSRFPELAKELYQISGVDIELMQSGIIKVAQTEEEVAHLKAVAAYQQSIGEEAEWLPAEELKKREPGLSEAAFGGVYLPNDGQVSAPLLAHAFAESAKKLGADMLEHTEVKDFINENGSLTGVKSSAGTFWAKDIIVAGGAWSQHILRNAGVALNVYPVKGECFSVMHDKPIATSSIFLSNGYIVPKSGGRTIIGTTQKPYDEDPTVQVASLFQLIEMAGRLLPELKNARWEKAWSGIRPQTGDGYPYIGKHPDLNGLTIATGHFRNGILLSPITGEMVADLMEGKAVDDTFRLDRKSLEGVKI
ncbi:glycine oxidase ThiO [Virgibacillus sp. SK37]|uniref:glycine oxidase ThiO n=1 Tax=Virgibacillus sp. SK37 TaxID=403957 RepID=UPI0004D14F9F|nr:glycine oxidase ThiO [Virgibacillus sp. SK37]AIF44414.1 glycine oxidase [Virgibacillus sp. SK37]